MPEHAKERMLYRLQRMPTGGERPAPYVPRGAAAALFASQVSELLIAGPAGTGKTRAALQKIHHLAETYPGSRHLIVRKTRASLTESALVTWEEKVVPFGHECLDGPRRAFRQNYRYPNGSVVVVGGMDKASRTLSTEYDSVFVPEATELSEDDWELLIRPLRYGKTPYPQLLGDTNPDRPGHWLKRRCDAGRTLLLESRHEDNPLLWDQESGEWTEFGRKYLENLDRLTGPRRLRLRFGRWVQAEGVVYEGWEPAIHLVDRFEVPGDWSRVLVIDFGFTNPFVAQWWALDNDGRAYRYREIYHTRRLVEDHARRIKELHAGEPSPVAVVCDHDAEDRATLERYLGWPTIPAIKDRSPGFQAVAARLRPAGDGKPRLLFLRDSLDERDPDLADANKPCCTEEEFDGYIWKNAGTKEDAVKENDHGMDAVRYLVAGLDFHADESGGGEETTTVLRVF